MKIKLSVAAAAFTLLFSSSAIAQTSQSTSPARKKTLAENSTGGSAVGGAAAVTPGQNAPRPKTELALACIFGMAPNGCDRIFVGGALPVFRAVMWHGGPDPYFRSAQYAGLNDEGDDVWDVKTNDEKTYVISQPGQDGGIRRMSVLQGPPNRQCINLVPRGVMNLGLIRQSCGVLFSSS